VFMDDFDYQNCALKDTEEDCRFGWYNPRKIPIKNNYNRKPMNTQIRNKLHYKFRHDNR